MSCAELLHRARRELAAGDGAFYGTLVAAWRAAPSAELAALIERAARLVAPVLRPEPPEWQQPWIARARQADPLELGALLDQLVLHVQRLERHWMSYASHEAPPVLGCLGELGRWRHDPVLTRPLIALLAMPDATAWIKVQTVLFELLEATGDPRAIAELAPLVARAALRPAAKSSLVTSFRRVRRGSEALAARFPAGVPPLDPACAPIYAELECELAVPRDYAPARPADDEAQRPELLAAIWADPRDDQRRRVYADALQAIGDPRGELIAAQLAATPAAAKRAGALVKQHRKRLLGPLAGAVVPASAQFARGFLVACEVRIESPQLAELLFDRPEWATVERLRVVSPRHECSRLTAAMRSIVAFHGLSTGSYDGLRAGETYPTLEVVGLTQPLSSAGYRDLFASRGLPALREIHVRAYDTETEWIAPYLDTPVGRQIAALQLRDPTVMPDPGVWLEPWLAVMRRHPRLRRVAFVVENHPTIVALELAGDAVRVALSPIPNASRRRNSWRDLLVAELRLQLGPRPDVTLAIDPAFE